MSGSPSRLTEPDTTLPGTPARKRHVRATNAWAQEQALEAERGFSMGSHDKQQVSATYRVCLDHAQVH